MLEQQSEPFMDRTQILRAIQEAYGSGRSIESVMRECRTIVRNGAGRDQAPSFAPDMEYGRSVYRKRGCGKVASFFRCLLRF